MLLNPAAQTVAPILVFAWGNPSRGDDALGPRMKAMLETHDLPGVELLTDFQLQIEHVVDLEGRACIVFIDASLSAEPPYAFAQIEPAEDSSYTTHAMSPEALMAVYCRVNKKAPPPCYLLSIRGYEFGLGLPMSPVASQNADQALVFMLRFIANQAVHSAVR